MIRLVAPKIVMRPVRIALHFARRTKEELRAIPDLKVRERMLARWPMRPFGHDVLELKCGHVRIRVRTKPGIVLWGPQECEMCTLREQEMNVRYIRSDVKKKRRARKAAAKARRVPMLRLKLRRQK